MERVILLTSFDLLTEVNRALAYEKIKRILDRSGLTRAMIMSKILSLSSLVNLRSTVQVIREDPADNAVLACARNGRASYIISGDKHLLNLGTYSRARIIAPGEFLKVKTWL